MGTVRERLVSDLGGEQQNLHQAFGAVDGSLARCPERRFNDRVDEIEASRDLGDVCLPKMRISAIVNAKIASS